MSSDSLIILVVAVVLVGGAMLPFLLYRRRLEHETGEAAAEARRLGLDEPATLHPVVDLGRCMGSGNCVAVCPEGDVLGLAGGHARVIAPALCIGHGLCERSCPTEAIRLVFGTEKRGVELPRIRENFETNVPGLYIVGELGGMGLIRNAFEQGRQCVEGIAREDGRNRDPGLLDLIVVGCGPGGLSTSLNGLHRGLRLRTFEREDIGGTVRHYPRKKVVMTAPVRVPGYGKLDFREIRKEELIRLWEEIVQRSGLEVNTGEPVERVAPVPQGGFEVTTAKGAYRARRVVLAIGRRGAPRRLGVPGEDLPKVSYALREPETYQGDRILVVGGGDAAIEAALALAAQPGNRVTISYRGGQFSRLKPANRDRVNTAVAQGVVEVLWSTNVVEIATGEVRCRDAAGGERTIANDYVMIFAGGELPGDFLRSCGIAIDVKFGAS